MMFDSVMPDFDLTTITGKQEFRKWFTGTVRNEIRSYTPEALGVSTSIGNVENTISNFSNVPTGIISPFGGLVAPDGWLLCDGSAIPQTVYALLYSVISTAYNTGGEPAGTFRVPDLRGRVPAGKDNMGGTAVNRLTIASGITGTSLGAAGGDQRIQDHTHTFSGTTGNDSPDHAHYAGQLGLLSVTAGGWQAVANYTNDRLTTGATTRHQHPFSGTTANHNQTSGGNSQNVQPSLITNYIIKT